MKNTIDHISVLSWTSKDTMKPYSLTRVYYRSNQIRSYTMNDILPMTVTMFLIESPVRTEYIRDDGTVNGIKREIYC